MALDKFNWQNGSQVEPAKVEVEGVSYDVVDAQYEGETPLSAANLNLMQDTLLGNVIDDLSDDTKIPSVKAVKGKILWSNPNPTSNFTAQPITLDNSDYDVLEVIFDQGAGNNIIFTQRLIKGKSTILQCNYVSTDYLYHRWRNFNYVSDTSYSFGSGYQQITNQGTSATANSSIIPLYVIGYKTNLF